jgi:hypothetical protein
MEGMPVKLTQDQVKINLSKKYPGYNFSNFKYKGQLEESEVICPSHGVVLRSYKDAMRTSSVCMKCSSVAKTSSEEFVQEIKDQCPENWNMYDYSKVEFKNALTAVKIGCPDHGEVYLLPNTFRHYKLKSPCTKCNSSQLPSFTTETFIQELEKIKPGLYSTDKVQYINTDTKVDLTCKICNTEFSTTPYSLVGPRKSGCPACARSELAEVKIKPWIEIFTRFNKIHGDKFGYLKDTYKSLHTPMTIVCKEHGEFQQIPANHESGAGCPRCSILRRSENKRISYEENLNRARLAHGSVFKYPQEGYTGAKDPMQVICKDHGVFHQLAYDHWAGHGCSKCANGTSKGQEDMTQFIQYLGINVKLNFVMKSGKHIDIFCEELNIGFEYHGLYWHSEAVGKNMHYHHQKTKDAEAEGIRLVQIFEDEWLDESKKSRTQAFIKNILNKTELKLDARKLKFNICSWIEAKNLLDQTHMQGSGPGTKYRYCLRNIEDKIVAVMLYSTSSRNTEDSIELTRFASLGSIRGGFSKLLVNSIKLLQTDFKEIISFSDSRLTPGTIYASQGFTHIETLKPDYEYYKGMGRWHKRKFQHQRLSTILKNYDPQKTEKENCSDHGYYRVWDCGMKKWKLSLK